MMRLVVALSVVLALTGCTLGGQASPSASPDGFRPGSSSGAPVVAHPSGYRFEGWGTSLAWWANAMGQAVDTPGGGHSVADLLFAPPTDRDPISGPGLALDIVRYNLGAGPERQKGPQPCGDIAKYKPDRSVPTIITDARGTANLSADANQLAVLRAAIRRIPPDMLHLEMFANSPPAWLTDDGCTEGGLPGVGNLNQANYPAYAKYLTKALTALATADPPIRFDTVEPFNEPGTWLPGDQVSVGPWTSGGCNPTGFTFCQEGADFTASDQLRIIGFLCQDLRAARQSAAGITTGISAPDGDRVDDTIADFAHYDQGARNCITQVNTHGYNGLIDAKGGHPFKLTPYQGGRRPELTRDVAAAGKRLWMSEFGTGEDSGVDLAMQVTHDLQDLKPAAWVYWQGVEGKGGWGLIDNGKPTGDFYALELFSRFIRPGDTILDTTDPEHNPGHPYDDQRDSLVTRSADGDRISVVITSKTSKQPDRIDLTGALGGGSWTVGAGYRTNGTAAGAVQAVKPTELPTLTGGMLAVPKNTPNTVTTYLLVRGAAATQTPTPTPIPSTAPPSGDLGPMVGTWTEVTRGGSPVSAPDRFTVSADGTLLYHLASVGADCPGRVSHVGGNRYFVRATCLGAFSDQDTGTLSADGIFSLKGTNAGDELSTFRKIG